MQASWHKNNLGDFGIGDFGIGDFDLGDFDLGDYDLGDYNIFQTRSAPKKNALVFFPLAR